MSIPEHRRVLGLLDLEGSRPHVLLDGGARVAVDLPDLDEAHDGSVVRVRTGERLRVDAVVAAEGTALAHMVELTHRHRLAIRFGDEVWAEVEAIRRSPGLDAPDLVDRTSLPFVTIDGPHTRDLDQAVFVQAQGDGWRVFYALADASWYVRPGSALHAEALRRGSSYYLPGYAVPMLPRPLSEGLVSLAEGVLRRALVFVMDVAADGTCRRSSVERSLIRSRAKLTFRQVQRFLERGAPLPTVDPAASIQALGGVGEALLAAATRRDVIQFRRQETDVEVDGVGQLTFVDELGPRPRVERYNEQLSLLCNIQGAELLRRHDAVNDALLQPIFRIHPAPSPDRIARLERQIEERVSIGGLDGSWRWQRGEESLAEYLDRLPREGRAGRLAQAIHRQAVLINVRSTFSVDAGAHFGIGADQYARFSAPMREIVGIFLHKEAMEALTGEGAPPDEDEALRAAVVERANDAKVLQSRLTKDANLFVLDHLFERDRSQAERPWRRGTVMGITRRKVHVILDAPSVEVKVYTRALAGTTERSDGATELRGPDGMLCRLGDEVEVRVEARQPRGRWDLGLRRIGGL